METMVLIGCGLLSGFLAGLLGIGGGFVVVPAMLALLPAHLAAGAPLPQVAVATSLAAMVPTTLSALVTQWRRGAVDAEALRRLSPGIVLGAWLGAVLLPHLRPAWVALVFAGYAGYFAWRQFQARPWRWGETWPVGLAATAIGSISVLAGVGGAVFTVPYLEQRALPMHRAVATSSGVALLLSLVALGSLAGQAAPVWWAAAAWVGGCAALAAPLGVRCAHGLPVRRLKQAFALLLLVVAVTALRKALTL
ncbi:MAG: sulfite exporter TauE/SafE family protein [Burkholderiales bacterium]|nr:sulfite exporter TauE/SafE family protein [Burkholderiales bacterium]